MRAFITGSGTQLPERTVPNEELSSWLGLEPAQILKSCGIRERRWVEPGTTTSALASAALRIAADRAAGQVSDLDYVLFGTMTPDRLVPGSASAVQNSLGLREIPCIDIRAACCNTLYGLQLSRALVCSGVARTVGLCLAEVQSPFLDLSPAAGTTSMLFGDGAAALIISADPRLGALEIIDVLIGTDGKYVDDLGIRCPGSEFGRNSEIQNFAPRMVGQSVILQASRKMIAASQTLLERNGLGVSDVSWVVPHQANANLLAQVARGLGIEMSKVVSVLERTGNTSSASMGLALDHLLCSGHVKDGDYLLMPAFAAGFTWGAALCRAV